MDEGETLLPAAGGEASLGAVIAAWGVQAIVIQSVLLREGVVLMFGSEFAWGVVLFAWLLGVAAGATAGGRIVKGAFGGRRAAGLLALNLAGLSAAAALELWAFRAARGWMQVGAGELPELWKTAGAALLCVTPCGALVGAAFPFACGVRRGGEGERRPLLSFGHVYALESGGSLIGGAVFSFWAVERLAPIESLLAAGCVTLGAAGWWFYRGRGVRWAGVCLWCLAAGMSATAVMGGDAIDRRLVERRWGDIAPGYELVAEAESRYQNLAVGRRADQYSLYCDGQLAADFPDPYTYASLAHVWMCQHPEPRRALLIGGGAEGLLAEILNHPGVRVDYVEADPKQIELIAPFLAERDRAALRDERVTVHHVDARYFVKGQRGRFDLVIACTPAPTSALNARFRTAEFYGELRRAMTERAVLCMTATAAPGELSEAGLDYLAGERATLERCFADVIVSWGDPAYIFASTAAGLGTADASALAERYERRGVESNMFHPAWFEGGADWLDGEKIARRRAALDEVKEAEVSTDARPIVYVQRLALWERQCRDRTGGGAQGEGVIQRLASIGRGEAAAWLGAGCAAVFLYGRLRHGRRRGWAAGAVNMSAATTGFATMSLSIVWLYAFQNMYGYVYQRVGWIIALFMGGLVVGSLIGQRWAKGDGRAARVRLIAIDGLLALLALSAPFAASALGTGSPAMTEFCISLLVALTGLLGGAAFATAGRVHLRLTGDAGASAGGVVGADHLGACCGALTCGLLTAPVLGTFATAWLLFGMKAAAMAGLAAARGEDERIVGGDRHDASGD